MKKQLTLIEGTTPFRPQPDTPIETVNEELANTNGSPNTSLPDQQG